MLRPVLARPRTRADVAAAIVHMRDAAARKYAADTAHGLDIKNGPGGIRDIEFLAQALQLVHAAACPAVIAGTTLDALDVLRSHGFLDDTTAARVRDDYIFLRRIEHVLQILEDRQIHALPADDAARNALARRVMGPTATADQFMAALTECTARVHAAYAAVMK
jgi:glutamate-ammonia-ligase adenylyltransferase